MTNYRELTVWEAGIVHLCAIGREREIMLRSILEALLRTVHRRICIGVI
jgi:hypothetical protein